MSDASNGTPAGTPAAGGDNAAPQGGAPDAAAVAAAAKAAADAAALAVKPNTDPLTIGEPAEKPAVPAADQGTGAVAYEATGDVGLDMALDFVGNLGLGPNDPAMAAAMEGKFDLLKAKLGALGDKAKGWERFVALAEKSHGDITAKNTERAAKDKKAIHEVVGGEENWKQIAEWAGKAAEPDEKVAVNAALKAGGIQAKAMAAHLANLYNKAAGTTVTPADPLIPGAQGGGASGEGPLSAQAYAAAVAKLRQSDRDFESKPAYVALQQRRVAGVRSGI